jgi:hypothetical protein
MENKKTDFHCAVRGLRCESLETNGAEPQAKGESVQRVKYDLLVWMSMPRR